MVVKKDFLRFVEKTGVLPKNSVTARDAEGFGPKVKNGSVWLKSGYALRPKGKSLTTFNHSLTMVLTVFWNFLTIKKVSVYRGYRMNWLKMIENKRKLKNKFENALKAQ